MQSTEANEGNEERKRLQSYIPSHSLFASFPSVEIAGLLREKFSRPES
jgi:hypothetical protein